jgi:hypothetical protein
MAGADRAGEKRNCALGFLTAAAPRVGVGAPSFLSARAGRHERTLAHMHARTHNASLFSPSIAAPCVLVRTHCAGWCYSRSYSSPAAPLQHLPALHTTILPSRFRSSFALPTGCSSTTEPAPSQLQDSHPPFIPMPGQLPAAQLCPWYSQHPPPHPLFFRPLDTSRAGAGARRGPPSA